MRLLVVGAGGHGKVVADAASETGAYTDIVFADDAAPKGTVVGAWPVVGTLAAVLSGDVPFDHFVVALGSNQRRVDVAAKLDSAGAQAAIIVHPSASVSGFARIGAGTVIFAHACINIDAEIGGCVIINTAATVDHDCVIGAGAHLSPRVALAGNVIVGAYAWVGIGACVRQGIRIGDNAVVGAGAAVVNDVPSGAVVAGVPARHMGKVE